MKKINPTLQIMLGVFLLPSLLISCCNYYKAISIPGKNKIELAAKFDSLKKANRTFILRNGEDAFSISKPVLNSDRQQLECTLKPLHSFNKLHLANGIDGKMRYKKRSTADLSVLTEVHVYIANDTSAALGKYSIALDRIKKIEVIEKDKKRTAASYILGGLGIAVAVPSSIMLLGVILAPSLSFSVLSVGLGIL